MSVPSESILWSLVAVVLAALAVPWFLWGSSTVLAGLPVWIWWHIGWLALTALVFAVFAHEAWGVAVEPRGETDG